MKFLSPLLPSLADILAIPLFLLAFLYFWKKPNKTIVEYLLLLFTGAGFVLDTLFTLQFFNVI
jgi:lipoprotein signal peptidase